VGSLGGGRVDALELGDLVLATVKLGWKGEHVRHVVLPRLELPLRLLCPLLVLLFFFFFTTLVAVFAFTLHRLLL
jgi:hypothetical protein